MNDTKATPAALRARLESLAEPANAAFAAKLLPTVAPERILGVRLPALRKIARELARGDWRAYLTDARDDLFEETMLQGMTLGATSAPLCEIWPWVERFVPKIDNWSVCDSTCVGLKQARRAPEEAWERILPYLRDTRPYFVRFGAVMLLCHLIEKKTLPRAFAALDAADCNDPAAGMGVAWAVATCHAHFPRETRAYLAECNLDPSTYRRALQKILESRRTSPEEKAAIRAMKGAEEKTAYLFDFDFTLADAGDAIVACFRYALGALGMTPPPEREIRATIGMSLESAFLSLGGAPASATRFRALFRERADRVMTAGTTFLPGAAETLKRLHARGARVAIISSKYRYRIAEALEKFSLAQYVDCIIGFEDVSTPKPDPEGTLCAIRRLGVRRDACVYVGDSEIDAETARAAGVAFVGVTTGTTPRAALQTHPHTRIIDSLYEL